MDRRSKEAINIINKKKLHLFILLGSIYFSFILLVTMQLIVPYTKAITEFHLLEILGILYMLTLYIIVPLAFISFLIILITYKDTSQNSNNIISEIPLTFIVLTLMSISFIFGLIMSKS